MHLSSNQAHKGWPRSMMIWRLVHVHSKHLFIVIKLPRKVKRKKNSQDIQCRLVILSPRYLVLSVFSSIERSGFEPWLGHCVVFLSKTLYSHSASLHPGVSMGTGELLGNLTKCWATLSQTVGGSHPSKNNPTPQKWSLPISLCSLLQTFILQTEGKTKWKLFKPLQELSQEASPDLELADIGEPTEEFDMEVYTDLLTYVLDLCLQMHTKFFCPWKSSGHSRNCKMLNLKKINLQRIEEFHSFSIYRLACLCCLYQTSTLETMWGWNAYRIFYLHFLLYNKKRIYE